MKAFRPHSWDCHHMSVAYLMARKSKDRRTQVGAVIVTEDYDDHMVCAKGYNGPLRGLDDSDDAIYQKPEAGGPSPFMGHAERNALSNAARLGVRVKGGTMYCTLVSCQHCAADIVNAGIRKIIFHADVPLPINTTQRIGLSIFEKTGVEVGYWHGTPLIDTIMLDGQILDLQSMMVLGSAYDEIHPIKSHSANISNNGT